MSPYEARVVLAAATQADGGCWSCCAQVVEHLVAALPAVDWLGALTEGEEFCDYEYESWRRLLKGAKP